MSIKTVFRTTILVLLLTNMLAFTINIQQINALHSSYTNNNNTVATPKQRRITVSFPSPKVTQIDGYDWLRIENCTHFTTPGQPMLPVKTVTVKLPERSTVTKVTVTVQESLLQGEYTILPVPQPSIVGLQPSVNFTEDSDVYNSTSPFPEEWHICRYAHGLDVETMTRVEYVILNLFPLKFVPTENKVLQAESISITINYVEGETVVSPTELKNIIITSPTLEPYAVELAEWKNKTGISSKVLDTTWIYHNYGGIDRQEQIRTCIKDFVATYGITYVTIFGDADQVPVRNVYIPDSEAGETYVPTDLYYADLDGTWDDNEDGLYADQRYDNVDGIPDVYVGRIPPSLESYAQTAVDKIKGYQQQFDPAQDWTRRIVLAAGTPDGFGTGFFVLKEYIAEIVGDKDLVKLYESYGNLSTGSMASEINKGALFVNFAGHGDPGTGLFPVGWLFYWVIPGLIWNGFGISDVKSLTNGFKLPVVTTSSCSTARFDDTDCIGEWFVLEPDGGSIGYFGATRIAYGYVDEWITLGLMGEMDWRVYDNYCEGFTKLSQMWGETISEYVQSHVWSYQYASMHDVKTFMEFVLLGDPTTTIGISGIIIRPDGSIDPPTAPITREGNLYTLTANIYNCSIVVERDNIVIDGASYTLHVDIGFFGIYMAGRNNVTVKNMTIEAFYSIKIFNCSGIRIFNNTILEFMTAVSVELSHQVVISGNNITEREAYDRTGIIFSSSSENTISDNNIVISRIGHPLCSGISLRDSSNNTVRRNNITWAGLGISVMGSHNIISENNIHQPGGEGSEGISLRYSSHNIVSDNYIIDSLYFGITLHDSFNNLISRNNIVRNTHISFTWGIYFSGSGNNTVLGNNITNNEYGIYLASSSDNSIYHNNFLNNTNQAFDPSINVWDDGYPSGGNYWSDYTDVDVYYGPNQDILGSDGVWDHPYVIDNDNRDTYPLVDKFLGECTVTFLTSPAGSAFNIAFMGKTYTNGTADMFFYGFSGSAAADCPVGYKFHHWVTIGNVTVSDATINPTSVTITCGGTIKAVFSPSAASIKIWSDKTVYHIGETMRVYVRVKNPGPALPARVVIALKLTDGSYRIMLDMTTTLPASFDSGDVLWNSFAIPSIPLGTYVWTGALLNPSTGAVISLSTWSWQALA